jgi:hypothetical protein
MHNFLRRFREHLNAQPRILDLRRIIGYVDPVPQEWRDQYTEGLFRANVWLREREKKRWQFEPIPEWMLKEQP